MSTPAFPQPWPKGVTHRYLTIAGATVDITGSGDATNSRCTGCPYQSHGYHPNITHERAQNHAGTCRALPRPTA